MAFTERQKRKVERTLLNKRSYKAIIYGRFFTCLISAMLQFAFYVVLLIWFAYGSPVATIVQLFTSLISFLFILRLIARNEKPSSKLSWILLICIFPIFGCLTYLVNGDGRLTRKMQKKVQKAKEENVAALKEFYGEKALPDAVSRADGASLYLQKQCNCPVFYDGEVEYFKSGEEMFPAMKETLRAAKQFILLDYFIIAPGKMWGEILEILLEKAKQGVQIRILYDDFGCMMHLPPKYELYLESLHENIRCMTFNNVVPFFDVRMNNREHRKIMVIDGKTAFTGGINLADEYIGEKRRFGYWKDTGVKICGDAVNSFTVMFFDLWNAIRKEKESLKNYLQPRTDKNLTGENTPVRLQPYDDSPLDNVNAGETMYVDIINRAEKYVYIFTPYLILDDFLRMALCQAALRGVDVRIVTPGIPDKKTVFRLTRANYTVLMNAGVKIYEYSPGFLHAKSILCDDKYAVVGTINFDYRSLYIHFENAVYFSGVDAVNSLKEDCEETFAVSKLCTKENTKRSILGRLFDAILRVFETLL